MTAGYGQGLAALQQAITDAKRKGTDGRLDYATWKDGETKVVRFLTDEVISAQFADWVLTNDGKNQDFMVDPQKGDFVTKYGGMTKDRGNNGAIIPAKFTTKGVGIAVLRLEIPDPANPGRFKVVDAGQTINVNGQTYQGRVFLIIKQGLRNFWNPLIGATERYGTLIDRDWAIKRVGGSTDTIYIPSDIRPDGDPELEQLRDPNVLKQYYGYGAAWNEADPNRFYYCPKTLVEWADWYSSEERAQKWLTPKATTAPAYGQPPVVGGFPGVPGVGMTMGAGAFPPVGAVPGYPGYQPPQVAQPISMGSPQLYPAQAPGVAPAYPNPPVQPQMPAQPIVAQQPMVAPSQVIQHPPQVAVPPQAPNGYAEFHPNTTLNPSAVANQPLPTLGQAPVLSTATGVPVIHQQAVPMPAPQVVAPPVTPQPAQPWGNNEDEAQAVPSQETDWAQLQATLVPQIGAQAAPAVAAPVTTPASQ